MTDNTKLFRQEKDKREKKIELIQEQGIVTIKGLEISTATAG